MNTALLPEGVVSPNFDPDNVDAIAIYRLVDIDEGTEMGFVVIKILPEGDFPAVWAWVDAAGTKESEAPYHSVEEAANALINEWGQI